MVWHPMLKSSYHHFQSSSSAQILALKMRRAPSKGSLQILENTGHAKVQDMFNKPYCQAPSGQPMSTFTPVGMRTRRRQIP